MEEDCCKWGGVECDGAGNVVSLKLDHESISGGIGDSSSLFRLMYLQKLNLAYNNFNSTQIPRGIQNLTYLNTLSLAECGLNGSFPDKIFHLPTLEHLDLSGNELLSGTIPSFTQTQSFKSIRLRNTNFSGMIPTSISNLKTLSIIDLSNCQFSGSIPSTFANLTQLIHVDLSYNFFTGSLPSMMFEGFHNLVYLDMGANSFSGNIPHSLFRLPSLRELLFGNNKFIGLVEEFPTSNSSNIVGLDFRSNQLEGPIPDSFFQLQSLEYLLLSGNLFNGTFQLNKIQSLANLNSLDLSRNNLSVYAGNINSSSFGFPRLEVLRLSSCNLYDFPDFIKYSNIRILELSSNRIAGEIPSWISETRLQNLYLSFNNLSGSIPSSLCSVTYLKYIDFSINILSGNIPPCLLKNLRVLNLGQNNISGRIPDKFPLHCRLRYLDLNNNTLEGEIPKSLQNCKKLEFMNVGNNIINDTFPCMLSSSLRALVLRSNRFHGEVGCQKSWPNLQILDVSSNNLGGSLESINFSGWSAMALGSDAQLRHNNLGYYPLWSIGMRLFSKGLEVVLFKIWQDFSAIDFSCNDFQGEIPNAMGDLSSLHLLNLSHNALNGSIPNSFGQLRKLESLDLSLNQLAGVIPQEIARLTFLSVLNLSYNNLVGEIPNGRQLQTFSADSFIGNAGLCGFNLNISCSSHTDDESGLEHVNAEEKRKIEWEYVCVALGYVVGLGSIVWLLLFCRSFRQKYFDKIDEVVEEILDGRNRRRRRRARTSVVRNRVRRQ